MDNTAIINKIRPFASFKTIALLLVATALLWGLNLLLEFISSSYTVATTATCSIAEEMTGGDVAIGASAVCDGISYPISNNVSQLLYIANLSPAERSSGVFTCELYVRGDAMCEFPTKE